MSKYPNIKEIQSRIISKGTAHITFHASDINDIIHPYSLSGYEYLSGGFIEFLDRFKSIMPKKTPIVLEVSGKQFNQSEKKTIDNTIWTHYGLYLSEASVSLKKTSWRMLIYLIFTVLSSVFLFVVANYSDEVIKNYGYLLFWFFGYRLMTHLLLDCLPIYKDYQWYRRLAALKLIFSDDADQIPDAEQLFHESKRYAREADHAIRNNRFVDYVLMEDSCVSLGCRIKHPESALRQSGAEGMEIISDEMADYLMEAIPFIKHSSIAKLEIEGNGFTEDLQKRMSSAIRNHLAFLITKQDAKRKANNDTSILFTICLLISTAVLYFWGKHVDVAVHEFILIAFWFFGDYLLEFVLLSRESLKSEKKILEKLANMTITFKQ